jgi:membrane-bound lytic murein transglycosylase D
MRLIFSALLALMLAACATRGPGTGPGSMSDANSSAASIASNPAANPALNPKLKSTISNQTIDLDHNSVKSLTAGGDLWTRIRAGFQIPDLDNDQVAMQLNWYVERPEYVQRMTERSQKYLYHIVEELEQRHMPTELALLPFIESAYNPQALSVAKAAGMWQFVPGTGRTYNLKQNMFQDERRDVLASTSAALDYLSKLHDMFGDWYLALAAYNWGEGNVQRAIARNQAKGLPTGYEDLRMPNETRNYVPKLQAVKNIIARPQAYGLALPSIPNHPYFVTVTTARDIDVNIAAKLAHMSLDEFRSLNPSFAKPVILGSTQILLPFENAENFENTLKTYPGSLSTWTTYTVSGRERPSDLATKLGVDASTLMSVNKIPAGMLLKAGSTVLVPKSDKDNNEDISADIAENGVLAVEPDVPPMRTVLVKVRRRESVAVVARRYGVSVGQIKSWNRRRGNVLTPGEMIVVRVPASREVVAEEAPVERRVTRGRIERVSARIGDDRPAQHRAGAAPVRVERVSARASRTRERGRAVAHTPTRQAAPAKTAAHATSTAANRKPADNVKVKVRQVVRKH